MSEEGHGSSELSELADDDGIKKIPVEHMPMPMDTIEGLQSFAAIISAHPTPIPSKHDLQGSSDSSTDIPNQIQLEGWYKKFCRWKPTSSILLERAERKILNYMHSTYKGRYVDIGPVLKQSKRVSNRSEERKMWTLILNEKSTKTPLIMVHGLCASVGLWAMNMDELSADRPVYAFDLLGFGRSSRPQFSRDALEAETQHVEAIEAWRKVMKLNRFVLLGHSMGGFLSTAYTIKYPDSVAHLILADPWGLPTKPDLVEHFLPIRNPIIHKAVIAYGQKCNPLALMRAAGPLGPVLVGHARPEIIRVFEPLNQNGLANVSIYIYHCNAKNPTGEEAFRTMMDSFGWAKHPMANRLPTMRDDVRLTMIYGGVTWLQQISEEELKSMKPDSFIAVFTIPEAGHHVYADNINAFNTIVIDTCRSIDEQ